MVIVQNMIKALYWDEGVKLTYGHAQKWINMTIKYLYMLEVDTFDAIFNFQDVEKDEEGLATMYALGKNMAWILKCIEAGKKAGIESPQNVKKTTNFIK